MSTNIASILTNTSTLVKNLVSTSTTNTPIMSTDTTNTLSDFDLSLALTQMAINSQMEYAWKAWKFRKNIQETITIHSKVQDEDTGDMVLSPEGLQARITSLTIDLSNGQFGQLKVTLTLGSGTVTYISPATLKTRNYAIDPQKPWRLSFLTDINKKPVDLNILATIEPATHRNLQEYHLTDGVFSIEYLFLKFTDVDLVMEDPKHIDIPPEVPPNASIVARNCLNLLLQGKVQGDGSDPLPGDTNEFMLGTVVRRNDKTSAPTFAMTDFIFDIHANKSVPEASTLAYLGMFEGKDMLTGHTLRAAVDRLTDDWVRPEQTNGTESLVSGVMAISKAAFMDKYLIKNFTDQTRRQPVVSGLTWTFSDSGQDNWDSDDIIDREWRTGWSWNFTITMATGTNRLNISGGISSYANMDGYTKRLGPLGHYHTEWIHMAGHQDLHGTVTLTGGGIGPQFNLRPNVQHNFAGIVVDKDEIEGGATVLNAFQKAGKVFGAGSTTAERLHNQQQEGVIEMTNWLDKVLKNINLDLSQHAFIPPGGGVFTFQQPRFSGAGDLLFDVIYQAP